MTRFIFSSVMFLVLLAWMPSAQATQNSKRPDSPSPVAVVKAAVARTASTAESAVAALDKTACRTAAAMDEEMLQAARKAAKAGGDALGNGLARLTAYWCSEDHYTRHHVSATGVRLHSGHCAVDPRVIPFGSVVQVEGIGTFLAVDTGAAVVSRRASRESGHNRLERHALVIDLFFENRREGERFAAEGPKYATIRWWSPNVVASNISSGSDLVAYDKPL